MYSLPVRASPPHEVVGTVLSIDGTLVRAEGLTGVAMHELVRVGRDGVWGEVVRLETLGQRGTPQQQAVDVAVIEAFEHMEGVAVGDRVTRTGRPLTVELGPGLLNCVFDGLQRPLDARQQQPQTRHGGQRRPTDNNNLFVPRGLSLPALDRERLWPFKPSGDFSVGDHISAGSIYGTVEESALFTHRIMLPPDEQGGHISFIAPAGDYSVADVVLEVEATGGSRQFTMMQTWPVRKLRPVSDRKRPERPMVTGVRMLDALFPCTVGGTVAVVGSLMNLLSYTITKETQSDVTVNVGCGLRSDDVTEQLMDLSIMTTVLPETGQQVPAKDRMVVVANATNSPLAAREASVLTGLTIAEYLRDQGYDVSLRIDTLFRWALAQPRQASPDSPARQLQLKEQLSAMYERAGRFVCEGTPAREGTITLLGNIGIVPDRWSAEDDLVAASRAVAQTVWAGTSDYAYVHINCLESKSDLLAEDYYRQHIASDFCDLRRSCLDIMRAEADLKSKAWIAGGIDKLSEQEQATMSVAKTIREELAQQNVFTAYDRKCPLYKTTWMMRNIVLFHSLAQAALSSATKSPPPRVKTWLELKQAAGNLIYRLTTASFEDFEDGRKFVALESDLRETFANLGCPPSSA